jgi:uncharacterized protein (TIGR03437 family)
MKFSPERRSLLIKVCGLAVLLVAGWAFLFRNLPAANANRHADEQAGREFRPQARAGRYYMIRELNGQRVCEEATSLESQRLRANAASQEMRVIYDGNRNAAAVEGQAQTGLRITLRATAQLDAVPEAKAAFIRAAQNWESQVLSPISVVFDVDYGTTFFGQAYESSNTIGATSPQAIGDVNAYGFIRQGLIAGASSAAETALYGVLPVGEMPTDQGNLAAVFTEAAVFRALGLVNPTANPDTEQTQLGRPPRIGFNSAFAFDFDPSDGISPTRFDFDGAATHEIGHALGFDSSVGDKELQPTSPASLSVMDFFRFRPGTTFGTFPTAQRILASGGAQFLFGGGVELGLSTGRIDSTGGDMQQAAHWKANEFTGVYIGVMDPTGGRGERQPLTQNDLHALDLIGYRLRSTVARIDGTPLLLDFGSVALNANADRTLTISNTGEQPLQVTGMTFGNAQYSRVSPGLPFTVAPGAQQAVVVRFAPTANGLQSGTLTVISNDSIRPGLTAQLNGFGGARPTEIALASGVAQPGMMAAPPIANDCQLDLTQYTIQVPSGATQLRVTLSGNQDIDLYGRFGQRVGETATSWIADHVSDSPNNTETITITPTGSPALRTGTYYFGVTNCGPGAASYTLTATITGGAAPLAAVSAASYRGTELTSESIASAFGQVLATGTANANTATLPTTLAGTTVRVRDNAGSERLAPLFFVSPGQINFLIPAGTSLGAATITVTNGNGVVSAGGINIVTLAPGLFAANADGQGVAAADAVRVLANGGQRFETIARFDTATSRFVATPIDLGPAGEQVFLVLYGTGLRNRSSLATVTAQIGGASATVAFAGAQGSLIGLDQVNVLLPRVLIGRGDVDVVLTLDGKAANTVRVNIR